MAQVDSRQRNSVSASGQTESSRLGPVPLRLCWYPVRGSGPANCGYSPQNRFPKNIAGPFYTVGVIGRDGHWISDCLACEAPEIQAPDLLAPLGDRNSDTYFVRQPKTSNEVTQACRAIHSCCTYALRYGGTNRSIIKRLGNTSDYSDFVIDESGRVVFGGDTSQTTLDATLRQCEIERNRSNLGHSEESC